MFLSHFLTEARCISTGILNSATKAISAEHGRDVKLTGEAFFEITPDAAKPFIIDAGKAKVRVVGTTFNVITNNSESAVEVFVKTGKVVVSDESVIRIDPA